MKLLFVLLLTSLVSHSVIAGEPVRDFIYGGTYEVNLEKASSSLNCRKGASSKYAIVEKLKSGAKVKASVVVNPEKPWFQLSQGCYVRASSLFLKWAGAGEDPSSLCDWRTENC